MAGSSFGTIFRITTWGESHGPSIGVVVDGCPAGLFLSEEDIQMQLNRRRPGQSRYSTPRNEADRVHILSGIFEGRTTGTPIAMEVINETQRSKITLKLQIAIALVMQIIHLIKSMVFAIIAAADAHPVVRQSDVWQVVLWL